MREKGIETFLGLMMLLAITVMFRSYLGQENSMYAIQSQVESKKKESCIVLDAGHGGDDPGKIGINEALEKEVNLSIVKKIKAYLEEAGIKVILTRETDKGLYEENAGNKKIDDLNKRCEIIEQANPDLIVSIHQNSYHEESVYGPQVFYYKTSKEGKMAADFIQKRFDYVIGKEKNTRSIKANDNYYLLIHTKFPIVICECGFLSNAEEANQLIKDEYQQKISWNVYMGILQYLNSLTLQNGKTDLK